METKEKKTQELYLEYQLVEQQIKQLQRQLELIANQMIELSVTKNSLDELSKIAIGKEIFVPLSTGVYTKASIKETNELLVNVGANVLVKKDVESTKMLIQNQIEEVKKVQKQNLKDLEEMANQAGELERQLQELQNV